MWGTGAEALINEQDQINRIQVDADLEVARMNVERAKSSTRRHVYHNPSYVGPGVRDHIEGDPCSVCDRKDQK